MIIRHAEKPNHVTAGVDANGQHDNKSLTPQGWQRAGALVQFFAPGDGGEPQAPLARPEHLFAAFYDAASDDDSKRPYETIEPLAQHLDPSISIDDSVGKDDIESLVQKVTATDGPVLIAWEHKRIPSIARSLLSREEPVPDWPDNRFDMVWVFDRTGETWRLTQVPQLLLAGDLPTHFS
ncbi:MULTISPECIES: histidine phosphatase family protein [unclassified Caballeronia]|uniref:histidine phosphatase family protein n=1 Tax=unclassified Caballeronia TaxID=2646786 RepID=UPI001F49A90E|nr:MULTISPECIES: histidine phosphatase family protein [unclassified Caballeronia]